MDPAAEQEKWAGIVSDFRKHKIRAFLPGDREFELSVATGNLVFRFTQPDCVVQPENAHEVGYIIKKAAKNSPKLNVTIKCGGHSYTGYWTTNNGILMDLRYMNDVRLELDEEKLPIHAVVAAGARWGDVYRKLMQRDYRSYIINGGRCPSVGVSGFLLGGGLGPFTRKVGMGCDSVIAMKMVNVSGEEIEITRDNEHKELFWALRGGGCANFGVVTEFTLKAEKLRGDLVTAARWNWMPFAGWKEEDLPKAKEILDKTMTAFYSTDWPVEMTIDTNWMMDVKSGKGDLAIRFNIYFDGTKEQFDQVINSHFVEKDSENPNEDKIVNADLKRLMLRRSMEEPSTRFLYETLVQMWEEEARDSLPIPEKNSYMKYSSFCLELKPEIATKAVEIVQKEQAGFREVFKAESASLWVTFIHSGGNVTKTNTKDTAYPWRDCTFQTYVTVKWTDKWLETEATAALFSIRKKLAELSMTYTGGVPASFVNFSDATLDKEGKHEMAYYGENHVRLRQIKETYDKDHFFKNPWDRIMNKPVVKKAVQVVPKMYSIIEREVDRISSKVDQEDDAETLVDYLDQLERLAEMAETLADLNATNDWDTYKLPPDEHLEDLYGRKYVDLF